ncbi:uncharacterized protein LOC135388621 isoform X2 [Ornithodoros turicata]|uniref:uncharacterized protein LOC135388621 isoform X2 n=1 Tax=Ornithodoros turicata TaxID=34597 RepID=UPI0031391CFC
MMAGSVPALLFLLVAVFCKAGALNFTGKGLILHRALCHIPTLRELIEKADKILMHDKDAWSNTYMKKKSCQEVEIIYNSISKKLEKCKDEMTRKRMGATADNGRTLLKEKCQDVELHAEASNFVQCLEKEEEDICAAERDNLLTENSHYNTVGMNTHDVCCAYKAYEKCALDKVVSSCGDQAKRHLDLLLEVKPSDHFSNFCQTYENSACDMTKDEPGSATSHTSTVVTLCSALIILLLC